MIYEYYASRWFIEQFLSLRIPTMVMRFAGVDPPQAGNVVQLVMVMVLGLTVGWISTYIFRVSNKEMTYAQQLRDYEVKVMQVYISTLFSSKFLDYLPNWCSTGCRIFLLLICNKDVLFLYRVSELCSLLDMAKLSTQPHSKIHLSLIIVTFTLIDLS